MSLPATAKPMGFIATADRARATPFYRDTLGCRLVSEDQYAATFDMAGLTVRLTHVPGHKPTPHTVFGWSVADIEAAARALAAKGVKFTLYEGFGQNSLGVWTSPDGKAKVAWFPDPDGNVLSLTQM
jgi:catechol 2,3-dioxygenase-like lactoylglutathione lyase family enzyme